MKGLRIASIIVVAMALSCGAPGADDDFEGANPLWPAPEDGKSDGYGVNGPPVLPENVDTRAWSVKSQWQDTDTPAAQEAGMAWPANSGLNWDEKFARWIESLQPATASDNPHGTTFELTTPWGKSIIAPFIDCADLAILLRASFAAWYELPFYLEAYDPQIRKRVYYGHMGIRTRDGVWNNMPRFARYDDYSHWSAVDLARHGWPQDKGLRRKGVIDRDEQPFIAPDVRTGAYLDEIHLNKRAAHLIRIMMIFTGTPTLADGRNTFNLKPEGLRVGDTLLYRRARAGSGHTMVVIRRDIRPDGKIGAETVSGNIPPSQPYWAGQAQARYKFMSNEGGGPTQNSKGETYSHIGGGLKRWRVAKASGGYWKNTFMDGDDALFIHDHDYDAIGARPKQFEEMLGEPSPEEKRDTLLKMIHDAREHLRQYPASCSARLKREHAFNDLYTVNSFDFDIDYAETDRLYRLKEDYVFAPLVYEKSKTCCWNSTTPEMFHLVMAHVEELEQGSTECARPPIFRAVDGGYELWAQYAASKGMADQWVPWSAGEECPQANAQLDEEEWGSWQARYCSLDLWSGTAPPNPEPEPEPNPPHPAD